MDYVRISGLSTSHGFAAALPADVLQASESSTGSPKHTMACFRKQCTGIVDFSRNTPNEISG